MVKHSLKKRIVALICVVLFVVASTTSMAKKNTSLQLGDELKGEEFILVGKNKNEKLYVSPSKAEFYVEDIHTGFKWYSNPTIRTDDAVASNLSKMEMSCLLLFNFINRKTGSEGKFNSYTGSTKKGDFKVTSLNGGFRIDMKFESYKLSVPLCVYLDEAGLHANLILNELKCEDEKNYLLSVQVLPYFGAGAMNEEGYLFVPDGCGGLIKFNNGKQSANGYERRVYGIDANGDEIPYVTDVENQKIKIPVFGVVRSKHSMLGIITSGDSDVTINAFTNGQMTENANVFANFTLNRYTTFELGGSQVNIFERNKSDLENVEILYCFERAENANYSNMAATYREWLVANKMLKEKDSKRNNQLFLTLNGGFNKATSVLGVPVNKPTSITNAEQAKKIVNELKKKGIDKISINYTSIQKSEYMNQISDSYKIEKCINNSEASFKELFKLKGVNVYPSLGNLVEFGKFKYPWESFSYGVKTLTGEKHKIFNRSLGTGEYTGEYEYYLASSKIETVAEKLSKSLEKQSVKYASVNDLGNILYSDYSQRVSKRVDTKSNIIKAFEKLVDGNRKLLFDNPNVYALKYANAAINVPNETSHHALIDLEVPFYQMVIGNAMPYSTVALNKDYSKQNFLKVLEFGSLVHYDWVYKGYVENTNLSGYNTDYKTWINTAVEQYKILSEIIKESDGTSIMEHNFVSDDVSVVTYENGCQIYINYSNSDILLDDGSVVEAENYKILSPKEG